GLRCDSDARRDLRRPLRSEAARPDRGALHGAEDADLLGRHQRRGVGRILWRRDRLSARSRSPVFVVWRDVRCGPEGTGRMSVPPASHADTRKYLLERVEDAAVVQLYADGFDELPLREKTLIYHLYHAAIAGRDIYYDQRYEHNLDMRDVLEEIVTHADGIDAPTLSTIWTYTKLFW